MSKRMHETAMAVLGDVRAAVEGRRTTIPADGEWQRSWLYYQASSVWAGTNEIQRTILGERVLGLPRPARPGRQAATVVAGRTRRKGASVPDDDPWCCTRCVATWPPSP